MVSLERNLLKIKKNTMKSNLLKKVLIILFAFLLSCSKEDNNTPKDEPIAGGEIFRFQIVSVDLANTVLTDDSYNAKLGSTDVTLTKSGDKKLAFFVAETTPLGQQTLIIAGLNNLKINYEIKEKVLTDTPANIIQPLTANFNTFAQTLDTSTDAIAAQNNINNFNTIFNNCTAAQKNQLATIYLLNKVAIDDIVLNDYSNISGRFSQQRAMALINKHKAAIFSIAVGSVMISSGVPIVQAMGLAIAATGVYKGLKFGKQFAEEAENSIGLEMDDVDGYNNRGINNTVITMQNDVNRVISFKSKDRKTIKSDQSKTQTGISLFFKTLTKYNSIVDFMNNLIPVINSNVPFANFSLLNNQVLPATSPTISNTVDAASFGNFTFTISNPNLTLAPVTFQSDGQMNLKISANTPQTTAINATIKYTYADNLSSYSGTIPVVISASNLIVGKWKSSEFKTFNSDGSLSNSGAILAFFYFTADGKVKRSTDGISWNFDYGTYALNASNFSTSNGLYNNITGGVTTIAYNYVINNLSANNLILEYYYQGFRYLIYHTRIN